VIAYLAPRWGSRRAAARARLEELAREAARPRAPADPWKRWNGDPGRASSGEDLGAVIQRLARERAGRW
jgi:hypothetical protein